MNLEPTGERMVLEHYAGTVEDQVIYAMHMATYAFARTYVDGCRVLDYGCGSGYGAAYIAEVAAEVRAVDVAEDAIAYARERYQKENLDFQVISADKPLPYADGVFDIVLSFQVFEHISAPSVYLNEINRVLAPGGMLILVTPDRSTRLMPWQRPWNRWHVREYSTTMLENMLSRYFSSVKILHMSGRRDVIDIELRRCRKLKWITLAFTLPIIPDRWRVKLLNGLHALRGRPRQSAAGSDLRFSASDITISEHGRPSLNLVALAEKLDMGMHKLAG